MAKKFQAIRGMNDVVPSVTPLWQCVEHALRTTAEQFGYDELRFPVLEQAELFKRTVGEESDIVVKEMYTFEDRNGDLLTLRPEGTAGCVRAGIEQGLLHNQIQRLWYMGPMFRHERPQKGRYRQFHQFGLETFGLDDISIDAEHILLMQRVFQELKIDGMVRLEINTLGLLACRAAYREHLVAYFSEHKEKLDEDSARRLNSNPLRILDSKNPEMQDLIKGAPKLSEHLSEEASARFNALLKLLDELGVAYTVNERLVRGLDYYMDTVYEWVTDELGAQGAVGAGGRYDGLVEQLGGKATPAVGFAVGIERLVALLEKVAPEMSGLDLCVLAVGDITRAYGLKLLQQCHAQHYSAQFYSVNNFKKALKRADKSGAQFALIVGDDEMQANTVTIKPLRDNKEQVAVSQNDLSDKLQELFA